MNRRTFLTATSAAALAPAALAQPQPPARATGGWKDGKIWVYSITYDEGPADLMKYAVPLHRKYGIPGHVAFVASQIGIPRNVPGSSYHGMMILSREQVAELAAEGWGFSSHSMNHPALTRENMDVEVAQSKKVLEDNIGQPVTIFCVPGSNQSHPAALAAAPGAGFQAIMTIYDWTNTKGTDLNWLGRTPLHTEYPGPFYSKFDPYKRLHQAADWGGWIIDYCHCPVPDTPIGAAKDCTSQELEARFEAVRRIGGDDVWLADPNDVVEFLLNDPESQQLRASTPSPLTTLYDAEMQKLYAAF